MAEDYRITSLSSTNNETRTVTLRKDRPEFLHGAGEAETPTPKTIDYGEHHFPVRERLESAAGEIRLTIGACMCGNCHPATQLHEGTAVALK